MRDIETAYKDALIDEHEGYVRAGRIEDAEHVAGILKDRYGHTTAVSAGSATRIAATFAASSGGSALALSGSVGPWTNGGTSETITDISVWTASSAGTFLFSVALTASKAWASADTFTLASLGVSLSPAAS
jgi:hypothetical protein